MKLEEKVYDDQLKDWEVTRLNLKVLDWMESVAKRNLDSSPLSNFDKPLSGGNPIIGGTGKSCNANNSAIITCHQVTVRKLGTMGKPGSTAARLGAARKDIQNRVAPMCFGRLALHDNSAHLGFGSSGGGRSEIELVYIFKS